MDPQGVKVNNNQHLAPDPLAHFRAAEQPQHALGVTEDRVLRKLLAIWPTIDVTWDPRPTAEDLADLRPVAAWRLVWRDARVDLADLADVLQTDVDTVAGTLRKAVAGRMIYPDGTVNEKVTTFLGALAVAAISKGGGSGGGRR